MPRARLTIDPDFTIAPVPRRLVSALAVFGGNRLRRVVSQRWMTRVAAAVLAVLAVLSTVDAIRG